MTIKGPYEIIHYFTGLSTDTKPTGNAVLGDRFFETDTRLWYIYDGSSWSVMKEEFSLSLYGKCSSSMTGSTTTLVVPTLVGYGNDFFNSKFYIQVIKNANSAGNAPEIQVRKITDYVSTSGTFTVDAFGANVEADDEIMILHESLVAIGRDDSDNVFASTNVGANADGSVLERLEWIQVAIGGAAGQLRTVNSDSEAVEENAIQYFNIGIFDVDAGAIALANIDITAISAVMEKSTGGGAFSSAGITQPTFSKVNGSVYCAYQFLAAEWATGDMYKLVVNGITATIGEATAYVPSAVWSNIIVEIEDIKNDVQYLYAVADGGTTSPAKVLDNSILSILMTKESGGDTSDFDNSTDSFEAISDKVGAFTGDGGVAQDDSIKASLDLAHTDLDAIISKLATGVGVVQIATTTEDLNQAASTYDLLTGTTQPVILESLSLKMPDADISGGALTYITIQTDDVTAQTIFNSTDGAKANLTSEAELSWTGCVRVNVGTKLTLTIAGGAAGTACAATITARYRAVVAGGTLA